MKDLTILLQDFIGTCISTTLSCKSNIKALQKFLDSYLSVAMLIFSPWLMSNPDDLFCMGLSGFGLTFLNPFKQKTFFQTCLHKEKPSAWPRAVWLWSCIPTWLTSHLLTTEQTFKLSSRFQTVTSAFKVLIQFQELKQNKTRNKKLCNPEHYQIVAFHRTLKISHYEKKNQSLCTYHFLKCI